MRVRFTKHYDHRWPSRAVTHFPQGYEGTVKREAGEAAIAKGRAVEVTGKAGKSEPVEPDTDPVPGAVTMGDQTPPVIVSE